MAVTDYLRFYFCTDQKGEKSRSMKIEYRTAMRGTFAALVFVLFFCRNVFAGSGREEGLMFVCVDAELQKSSAQGSAALKGAGISIWQILGAEKSFVKELKTDEDGKAYIRDLPPGKYLAMQTASSKGYLADRKMTAVFLVSENGGFYPISGFEMPCGTCGLPYAVLRERIKRADLRIRIPVENGESSAGVPIRITLLSTEYEELESHDYVTDADGTVDTSVSEICFGGNRQKTKRDGALVFGLYRVTKMNGNKKTTKRSRIFYSDANGSAVDPVEYFENGVTYDMRML